jgi:membrane protein DedA with SNARE-associated domain
VLCVAACIGLLVLIVAARPLDGSPLSGQGTESGTVPYLAVFLLVLGDAVIAILPGETTLNVAATMAASGVLELRFVIVAGAAGAVIGDSTLYAIARRMRPRVQRQLDTAMANSKIATAMSVIGSSAPALLVFGRYLPGMRFVVNASLGLAGHPYREFLAWSIVGGVTWSIYCSTVAYLVGTALVGHPLASVVLSALASSLAVAIVILVLVRRLRRTSPEPESTATR